MGTYKKYLKNVKGLKFYRLLGTGGKTGFGLYPDFKTYCFYRFGIIIVMLIISSRKTNFFQNILEKAKWNTCIIFNSISIYWENGLE